MRIDRLQRLIAVLEAVPPDQLKMENWTCGTAACAAGWGARDPALIAEGLHLEPIGRGSRAFEPVYEIDDEKLDGFDALQVFFELTDDQTFLIFSSFSYEGRKATPAEVIEHISLVLEEA